MDEREIRFKPWLPTMLDVDGEHQTMMRIDLKLAAEFIGCERAAIVITRHEIGILVGDRSHETAPRNVLASIIAGTPVFGKAIFLPKRAVRAVAEGETYRAYPAGEKPDAIECPQCGSDLIEGEEWFVCTVCEYREYD